jgi:hypothetical protein
MVTTILAILLNCFSRSTVPEVIADFESNPGAKRIEYNNVNEAMIEWLKKSFREEGYFQYLYNPQNDEYSTDNNIIRQLMSSRKFAELSPSVGEIEILHRKNLEYIFTNWYKELGDLGYIYFNETSKLGDNAMALRTLVYSPFFDEYSKKAAALFKTIVYSQNDDGSFEPCFIEPKNDYDKDYYLTFYSGEAILGLIEYYEKTKDPEILKTAIKSQDFYVDRYVTHLKENYYPAYVPWHTQCLNKLYKITGNKKYADAIFVMNDELLKIQNTNGKPDKKYLGRFYNPKYKQYGSPHSSSDGVYTEGLAYAYEIAKMVGDKEHEEKYKKAIILGVHNLMSLQYTEDEANKHPYPERLSGAIRYTADDPRIRIDTVQHTIDAFTKILQVMFD